MRVCGTRSTARLGTTLSPTTPWCRKTATLCQCGLVSRIRPHAYPLSPRLMWFGVTNSFVLTRILHILHIPHILHILHILRHSVPAQTLEPIWQRQSREQLRRHRHLPRIYGSLRALRGGQQHARTRADSAAMGVHAGQPARHQLHALLGRVPR